MERDPANLPSRRAALLLGTARYAASGRINLFFQHRIEAAVRLFEAGRIDYIVASGDNSHASYNEPQQMFNALRERGIPEDAIVLDYAGFRTLDSVVRMNRIFGQEEYLIVSQSFHLPRALYIARSEGHTVDGMIAEPVRGPTGARILLREYLARVRAFLDIHLLGTGPRFLGEPIDLGDR